MVVSIRPDSVLAADATVEQQLHDVLRASCLALKAPLGILRLFGDDRLAVTMQVGFESEPGDEIRFSNAVTADEDLLVVPDAALDLRFRPMGFVSGEPKVRFMAGAPILDSMGVPVGTITVMDIDAREGLGADGRELLSLHAAAAARLIAMHRDLFELRTEDAPERDDRALFFEVSPNLLAIIAPHGRIEMANPSWHRVLDIPASDVIGRRFLDLIHPDDRSIVIANAEAILSDGGRSSFETRCIAYDGTFHQVSWEAMAGPRGRGIWVVGRDVTSARAAEKAMRRSEAGLRELIERGPDGILVVGDGLVRSANLRAAELFGCPEAELVGTSIGELLPSVAPESDAFDRTETQAVRLDGDMFPAAVSGAVIEIGGERVLAVTVVDRTARKQVENDLMSANAELQVRVRELQRMGRETELVAEMSELLQSCRTVSEAYLVVDRYAARLFGNAPGAVFVTSPTGAVLERVAVWGTPEFPTVAEGASCWALRRGRPHVVADPDKSTWCDHGIPEGVASICVPLLAQGEAIGVVTVTQPDVESGDRHDRRWASARRLATSFADHLALALSNLTLRETLRAQSIRDPLTGLFNRRYLEESLERELARARRRSAPVGVIMIDVDHFKALNDAHGHRAGDRALVEIGRILEAAVRTEDIPCRYGGEEFAIVMPDADLQVTRRRAEDLRRRIGALHLQYEGRPLGELSISAGVAAFPTHGLTPADLLDIADHALYAAKEAGRNTVIVAEE